ncbi:MAG: hypothetical protein AB1Z98_09530, partial [Nannocystaceae bacterium]
MRTPEPADDIDFLDDSIVELIEEQPPAPAYRLNPLGALGQAALGQAALGQVAFEDAVTRVWIRPYAARLLPRPAVEARYSTSRSMYKPAAPLTPLMSPAPERSQVEYSRSS